MGRWRKVVFGGLALGAAIGGPFSWHVFSEDRHSQRLARHVALAEQQQNKEFRKAPLPTRAQQLGSLQGSFSGGGYESDGFDVLVIGGGATGAGCALDAVSRGLRTAMVEADDFASGTSSRSTKLIHGGVRYLQKAVMGLDWGQYKMVEEALHERANLLDIAPHLSFPLPIMLPVYKYWQIPYFWLGIKAYDFVSGSECLKASYYLNKESALEIFPMLKRDQLKGAIVYYDGSHNDARMCLSIALTAARQGAVIANHVRVTGLTKDAETGKVTGATMEDTLTGKTWTTRAKCVINATGPFTDSVRKMDDPTVPEICCPSSGVHIILPDFYSPANMGLLDPETSDGRVIFFLPWQGVTIAGTTDTKCAVTHAPAPSEDDIQFILNEVKNYLTPDIDVRRGDVLSAWAGIRPLVKDPNKPDTQSLVRNHVIHVSKSGLVTIAGGKWTTYRSMAVETLDAAVAALGLPARSGSMTDGLLLEGAHAWTPTMFIRLVQDMGLDSATAVHLAETYGDRAFSVAKMAKLTGKRWPLIGKKIHEGETYIDAEVRYACRVEYAATAIDVIARRLRLAFTNVQAAEEALPIVVSIMAEELGWDEDEKAAQTNNAQYFLSKQMGQGVNKRSRESMPISLTEAEIAECVKRFNKLDAGKKGYLSLNDIRESLKKSGESVSGEQIHSILSEIDLNNNGTVELDEYLQFMSAVKSGTISHSRFVEITDPDYHHGKYGQAVERSGGGV